MTVALILVAVAALFAALGGGFALGLHLFKPAMPRKKRIAWSAGLAAILPMILPLVGFLIEGVEYTIDEASDLVLGTLALLSGTAIAGMVLCLPTAWWVTTRLEASDAGGGQGEEPPLLEDKHDPVDQAGMTIDAKMEPMAG